VTRWMTIEGDADKIGSFGFAPRDPIARYDTLLRVDVRIGRFGQTSRPRHHMLLPGS
jgi:hypothetical protein